MVSGFKRRPEHIVLHMGNLCIPLSFLYCHVKRVPKQRDRLKNHVVELLLSNNQHQPLYIDNSSLLMSQNLQLTTSAQRSAAQRSAAQPTCFHVVSMELI